MIAKWSFIACVGGGVVQERLRLLRDRTDLFFCWLVINLTG